MTPPPLGIIPEALWEERASAFRIVALEEALERYWAAGIEPPPRWLDELLRRRGFLETDDEADLVDCECGVSFVPARCPGCEKTHPLTISAKVSV
jgi:hypothetical protein